MEETSPEAGYLILLTVSCPAGSSCPRAEAGTRCDNHSALGGGRFCVSPFLFGALGFGLGEVAEGVIVVQVIIEDEAPALVLAAFLNRAADGGHEGCAVNFGKCCSVATGPACVLRTKFTSPKCGAVSVGCWWVRRYSEPHQESAESISKRSSSQPVSDVRES